MTQEEKLLNIRGTLLDALNKAEPGTQDYNDKLNDYEQFEELYLKTRKQNQEESRMKSDIDFKSKEHALSVGKFEHSKAKEVEEARLAEKKLDNEKDFNEKKLEHAKRENVMDFMKNIAVQGLKGVVMVGALIGVCKVEENTVISNVASKILGGIIDCR